MRILFVLGDYYPKASANGVCVLNLQEALLARGIHSDVICEGAKERISENKFGKIFYAEPGKNGKLLKLKRLFIWPIKNVSRINNYYRMIKEATKGCSYDLVVSVLRPIEGAVACARVGNFVLYELDSISNNGDNLYGIKHLLRYRAANLERYIYKRAERIIHLSCHKEYYASKKKYKRYDAKSIFTDIPHLTGPETAEPSAVSKTDSVCITYLGSLSSPRNTPDYSLELIAGAAKERKIACSFYSRGCEAALDAAARKNPEVFFAKGYVPQEQLPAVRGNTDIFLSIGFAHTGTVTSIPSKIFEYMRTGKPILHVIGGKNDTAIPYLHTYGNALLIDPNDNIEQNIEKTVKFIENNLGRTVDAMQLRNALPMNTPEYTVELLIDMIEGGTQNHA